MRRTQKTIAVTRPAVKTLSSPSYLLLSLAGEDSGGEGNDGSETAGKHDGAKHA